MLGCEVRGCLDMRYKVIYHIGENIDARTKVESGVLTLDERGFRIEGAANPLNVPYTSIRSVEQFRMHGLGRMLKISLPASKLFVTVVRFNLGGVFAMVNFFKAGELHDKLQASVNGAV